MFFRTAGMKGTTLLLLLTVGVVGGALVPRALWQFGRMISCAQPGVSPLAYNNYGCWCGLGGTGTPVDEVDKCCQVHDKCYEKSRKTPGCTSVFDLPHILVYHFKCFNEQMECSDTNNKCQAAVCECDRAAAQCFAQSTYNPDNKDLDSTVQCVD